jgi:RNA polymerase sigma-70 factor, ECF subfamily
MSNDDVVRLAAAFYLVDTAPSADVSDPQQTVTDLYVAMRPAVLGYVRHIVSSGADAEDIVQHGFLRLYLELERGGIIQSTRSWIYRVVRNLALDHLRRCQTREAYDHEWEEAQNFRHVNAPTIERTLIDREAMAHALTRLSARERECLLLRTEGLTYAEISDVLSVSVQAVGVYLTRGLRKLSREAEAG